MTDTNFVVYAYIRSKDTKFGSKGTYYYIGKGRPGRPYACGEKDRIIKCPKDKVNNILILHSNLDEKTAFLYEKLFIQMYGRINTTEFGVLRNLTDGGEGFAGIVFTDKHKEKISKALSKPGDWYHPKHGKIMQKSASELVKMFPEQKLNRYGLKQVSLEKHSHRCGWKLLKNKDLPNKQENNILRDWVHGDHGKVLQTSATKLVKMFPDQKLHQGALSQVALGKYFQHKGWRVL